MTPKDLEISLKNSLQTKRTNEISIYNDGILCKDILVKQIKKLKSAFPKMEEQQLMILVEEVKKQQFTNQRFIDAVNNVIRTCIYPSPQLAQILGYDQHYRLYSYYEVCNLITNENATFNDFTPIDRNEKKYWVAKTDIERYDLKFY